MKTVYSSEDGRQVANIEYVDGGGPLQVASGELHGLYAARDEVVGGFIDKLDEFAGALAFEFNKVYSQGQGATGYSSITSVEQVDNAHAELDAAGLDFTPVNGSFNVVLYNTTTKLHTTHTIAVDLNGLQEDSSLASVAAEIDAIDGVRAEITSDNRLKITAESADTRLAFDDDNSGFLAAIGINTFFTGSKASDLAVNAVVDADGSKFAASEVGKIGVDVGNAKN